MVDLLQKGTEPLFTENVQLKGKIWLQWITQVENIYAHVKNILIQQGNSFP